MEFHLLCGIPGSGKSTVAKDLSGFVVSTDAIRKFLWDDESVIGHHKLIFEIAEIIMKYMLSVGNDVIFDATNLTIKTRLKYIRLAKALGAKVTVHWVNCPLEVAISRNAGRERQVPLPVIKAFHHSLQPPTIAEGMDQIIIYQPDLTIAEEITAIPDN